jgi:hypothetical protein
MLKYKIQIKIMFYYQIILNLCYIYFMLYILTL